MDQAGLTTAIDVAANVVGRYAADDPNAPTLILASAGRRDFARAHYVASLIPGAGAYWEAPALLTVATKGEGIEPVIEALDHHHSWMETTGELERRRRRRLATRTREVVDRAMRQWVWQETRAEQMVRDRLDDVAAGRQSPYELASEIVSGFKEGARV